MPLSVKMMSPGARGALMTTAWARGGTSPTARAAMNQPVMLMRARARPSPLLEVIMQLVMPMRAEAVNQKVGDPPAEAGSPSAVHGNRPFIRQASATLLMAIVYAAVR